MSELSPNRTSTETSSRRKSFSSIRSRVGRKKKKNTLDSNYQDQDQEAEEEEESNRPPFLKRESEGSIQFSSGNANGVPSHNHSPSNRFLDLPTTSSPFDQSHSVPPHQQQQLSQPLAPPKSAPTATSNNDSFFSSIAQISSSIVGLSSPNENSPNSHPLEPYLPLIARSIILTSIASILLSKLHWTLPFVSILIGCHVLWKQLERLGMDLNWNKEEMEANKESHSKDHLETANWVNAALSTIWPLINSEYFVPFADLLEDSLMQQVPGIVHGVRVEDMDQGSVPLKLQSFKILGNSEYDFLGTKPDSEGKPSSSSGNLPGRKSEKENNAIDDDEEERLAMGDEDENGNHFDTGDYVNLEVTFGYRVPRDKRGKSNKNVNENITSDLPPDSPIEQSFVNDSDSPPAESIHLLIYMSIGLQKIAAVQVPVWVEMLGIQGKMRLRLQVMPAAPFVKHVAFTFVESPRLEMAARPLGKRMVINAMDLPLISSYVLRSVEDVIKGFISPKSYTLDVAALLGSGDGPQDAYNLGVICIVIHQATDLAASDVGGTSDPFTQISFARAGRPLFTTKVCVKTKNPIWQETAYLLVGPDEVRDHERLRLTVYDADRFSADDPLGKVELSLARLIRQSQDEDGVNRSGNLLQHRTDKLKPMRSGGKVQGSLRYSIGFFHLHHIEGASLSPKRAALLDEAHRRAKNSKTKGIKSKPRESYLENQSLQDSKPTSPDSKSKNLPDYMTGFDKFVKSIGLPIDDSILEIRRQRDLRIAKLLTFIEGSQAATSSPPDFQFPSGILVFHIHSLDSLEVSTTKKSLKNVKHTDQKQRYSSVDDGGGQGGASTTRLPSSYVQVMLNDEPIFRTRTKPLNARPYVNGGGERFISDWTTSELCFVVKDSRMRENDAILGVVRLKLTEVFKSSSKITDIYTITGGLGYGKIRISLIFRSVELQIPRPLRGWGIGVLEISSCRAFEIKPQEKQKNWHVVFETVGGKATTHNVEPIDDNNSNLEFQWPLKEAIRIPVRQRYPSFLYIHLRSESKIPGRHHSHAHTVIPLNRIEDDKGYLRKVPLFETNDPTKFDQDMMRMMSIASQLKHEKESNSEEGVGNGQDLPVLEDLCFQAEQELPKELPKELSNDGRLKIVGNLELSLIFHSGLNEDFRGLCHGDHELRYAYEAYLTAIDAGERPRSNKLKRRELNQSIQRSDNKVKGKEVEESFIHQDQDQDQGDESIYQDENQDFGLEPAPSLDLDTSMIDSKRRPALPARKRTASLPERATSGLGGEDESYYDDEDITGMDYGEEDESNFFEYEDGEMTPEGRRARQRSLHRQHRGAAQIKGVRTLGWLKTNAQDGIGRLKKVTNAQSKKMGKMESEGVSHF